MKSLLKKKQFWGGLIAIGILTFLFYDLNVARTYSLAKNLKLVYLAPVFLCSTLIMVFKALRWRTIVSRVRKTKFWPALTLYSTAQAIGVLLPALTGQAGRVIFFSRKVEFSKTYAFSTIFLEIVFDGAGLIVLMLISSSAFAFPPEYRKYSYMIGIATILLFVFFYLSLHFQNRMERIGRKTILPLSRRAYFVLRKFFRSFNEGLSVIKSTDKLFVVSLHTFLSWLAHVGAVFFLLLMFDFKLGISREWAAVVIIIINYLALMLPITPGNVGTFQLAVVAGLNLFGVEKTGAVLFSVILYLVDMVPIFTLSAFFLFKEKFSLWEISEDEELIAEVEQMVVESDMPAAESGDRV